MSEDLPFHSGSLALDLLNTLRGHGSVMADDLASPGSLRSWLRARRLTDAMGNSGEGWSPASVRILLTETRRLRDEVSTLVEAHRSGGRLPAPAIFGVNRVLAASRRSSSLVVDADATRLAELETGESPLTVLAPIARAAADLIVTGDPARIRRCDSEACSRWFLDTSKGGRRKWCSMTTCGNRAKAAAHRRRRATA